ncbi:MAG TPA: SRPBCC domain-containing protein [Crocinitomicaceae bacterium]|nr:SRPBCC domain-containing protein [Crocinitomicaceae bacterium]
MMKKEKYELEFLFKTSPKVLDNMITTPSGLSEWFADDVNIKDDIYTFIWDGSEEDARLITKKTNSKVKFRWMEDEEDGNDAFFELRYEVDPMTKMVLLTVTAFAESDEMEDAQLLWQAQIEELKRTLGA